MFPYRRCRDAVGVLLQWLREVADLTLAIAQVIFGAILLFTVGYAAWTDRLYVLAHGIEAFALVTCLRIVVAPPMTGG